MTSAQQKRWRTPSQLHARNAGALAKQGRMNKVLVMNKSNHIQSLKVANEAENVDG